MNSKLKQYYILDEDNNQVSPPEMRVNVKGQASFYCHSSGDTMWFFGQNIVHNNPKMSIDNKTLTFDEVDLRHIGKYLCYGLYPSSTIHFVAKTMLYVYGEPILQHTIILLFYKTIVLALIKRNKICNSSQKDSTLDEYVI